MRATERSRHRHLVTGHSDVRPADAAVAQQRRSHEPHRVAGNGEAQSLRRQNDGGVDANDLSGRRDERPAGVAGIQRRVGLDDVVDQAPIASAK